MKRLILTLAIVLSVVTLNAKTLIVYYSFSNNIHTIVSELNSQIEADLLRIEPAEKGLDYAANNYAIGSALINTIRQNPNNASSYPAIDPVDIRLSDYDMIIIAAPLWWNNMAAPLQTFLFSHGSQMAGKNIGVIVSSASSGISGVVQDAKRLIPNGNFIEPNLRIRSSEVSRCRTMLSEWLDNINYASVSTSANAEYINKEIFIVSLPGIIMVNGCFKTFSLYNESGYKLLETSEKSVNTSDFVPGIYIAHINKGDRYVAEKLHIK